MASGDILIASALTVATAASIPFVAEWLRPQRPDASLGEFAGEPGHRTHYQWLGPEDGPIAVCVHGLTTPSFVWEAFAPVLARQGYRVLLYDLCGRGLSDRPKGSQTGAYFAGQLDRLLDELGVTGRVTLLGYSMGGAIAAFYAATRTNRVERLVLIAPAGFGHDLGHVVTTSERIPALGWAVMRLFYPISARRALEADRDLPCAVEDMISRQINATRWRGFAPVVWSSIHGILSEDLEPRHRQLASVGTPTLAIWGEEDEVIPIAGMDRLGNWNPSAEHKVITGAGHSLLYTHVSEVETACMRFLSRPDG